MNLQKVIDIHIHIINFDYMPDRYTIHLIRNVIGKKAYRFSEEDFSNPKGLLRIVIKISDFIPGLHVADLLRSMRERNLEVNHQVIDNLIDEGEYLLTQDLRRRYKSKRKAELVMFVPLMMDFVEASEMPTPTNRKSVIPFEQQIKEHAVISRRHPWKVFPFFHYHPERDNVYELFCDAIENKGFIGVKLYPAMGYYPDCTNKKNLERVNENLKKLYKYIRDNKSGYKIPITTHAQYSSTQAIDLTMLGTMKYTNISNWKDMIKKYDLKVNFAHFGGQIVKNTRKSAEDEFAEKCRMDIISLMFMYNDESNHQIFADTAAHSKSKKYYFNRLNDDLSYPERLIMYGSDLPVITARKLNKDYINKFVENIEDPDSQERFFRQNARLFLFENGKIPPNYIKFLQKSYDEGSIQTDPFNEDNLPDCISKNEDGDYIIV